MKKTRQIIISIVSAVIILTSTGSAFAQDVCVIVWECDGSLCEDWQTGFLSTLETSRTEQAVQELEAYLPVHSNALNYIYTTFVYSDGTWKYYEVIPGALGASFNLLNTGTWDVICGVDIDEDAIPDEADNCLNISNPNQEDEDSDSVGDVCDSCPIYPNPDQFDCDSDGVGDICDANTVYGYIKDSEGAAIVDVTVAIVRVSCGSEISVEASTNALGYYAYGGLESGYTYGVGASKELYSFAPIWATWGHVTIPQTAIQSYDFTGTED